MKIYSGIADDDGNIPWIDDETGETGADPDGPRTLNLNYKRTVAKFGGSVNPEFTDEDLELLQKALT